ncbi:MAG: hypothetical protein AYK19_08135 [Theionarchaea archaeon DG-70-1]|nr:MAG: hypothetical protein AYK19_08135 [Theionarchaea archaeon DG-70-1]
MSLIDFTISISSFPVLIWNECITNLRSAFKVFGFLGVNSVGDGGVTRVTLGGFIPPLCMKLTKRNS